jgi:hypothetical protein
MGLDGDLDVNIGLYGTLEVKNSSAEYGEWGERRPEDDDLADEAEKGEPDACRHPQTC